MSDQPPTGGILRRGLIVMWRQVRLRPVPFVIAVTGAMVYAVGGAYANLYSSWRASLEQTDDPDSVKMW